jgi:hypothetical protein
MGDARRYETGYCRRMHRAVIAASMVALVCGAGIAAAEPVAYPTKGQSSDRQKRDENECRGQAQKETGVDPVAVAEQATASKSDSGGKPGPGSAAGGAALGAMRGAADGNAAGGAAHGAARGRLFGAIRARRQEQKQEQASAQQNADLRAQLDRYNGAYAACLTKRG